MRMERVGGDGVIRDDTLISKFWGVEEVAERDTWG